MNERFEGEVFYRHTIVRGSASVEAKADDPETAKLMAQKASVILPKRRFSVGPEGAWFFVGILVGLLLNAMACST